MAPAVHVVRFWLKASACQGGELYISSRKHSSLADFCFKPFTFHHLSLICSSLVHCNELLWVFPLRSAISGDLNLLSHGPRLLSLGGRYVIKCIKVLLPILLEVTGRWNKVRESMSRQHSWTPCFSAVWIHSIPWDPGHGRDTGV